MPSPEVPTTFNGYAEYGDFADQRLVFNGKTAIENAGDNTCEQKACYKRFETNQAEVDVDSQRAIYRSIVRGEPETSKRTQEFYTEYFAVLDMAAEFYLETVERVFQKDLLARGEMTHHGRPVRPELITKTALLTIEAERDDLCAPGQTAAAHALLTGIDGAMHRHHLAPGVGHYGVFAGSRWTSEVYPVMAEFIREADET